MFRPRSKLVSSAPGRLGWCLAVAGAVCSAGCGGPNKANIELRKQNQGLSQEIDRLNTRHAGDEARIRGLEDKLGTRPTLPQSRLDELYTVHGIKFGRLTGGADLDPTRPGDEALKVYLSLLDETGDEIKSTGAVTIEVFDLALPGQQRLGRWEFSSTQTRDCWYHLGGFRTFVFACPWQTAPTHSELTLKLTFRDTLTGRLFDDQRTVHVTPPTTAPAR